MFIPLDKSHPAEYKVLLLKLVWHHLGNGGGPWLSTVVFTINKCFTLSQLHLVHLAWRNKPEYCSREYHVCNTAQRNNLNETKVRPQVNNLQTFSYWPSFGYSFWLSWFHCYFSFYQFRGWISFLGAHFGFCSLKKSDYYSSVCNEPGNCTHNRIDK